ncbi:hypothetical protein, partial [Frankia sp. AgKG'84/4]|uniref:hypothetical protein n=1 Tax=Frankia sp. AgKG'84/4 TaxID=573490 RepID=UPI002029BC09
AHGQGPHAAHRGPATVPGCGAGHRRHIGGRWRCLAQYGDGMRHGDPDRDDIGVFVAPAAAGGTARDGDR